MKHPFHLVDQRPWPLTGAIGSFLLFNGIALKIHKYEDKPILLRLGLTILLVTVIQWCRDLWREGTYQGKHTIKVESGLRTGILLFITSEVLFFFSFFWAFFHSSLSPNQEIGSVWPPIGVVPIRPFEVPLLNTIVLLTSGATITWAHMSLVNNKNEEAQVRFSLTVVLGLFFTLLQWIEYKYCTFTIRDSIYGRTFYIATGFHGFHVIVGTLIIRVIWYRHRIGHFSTDHHFGFERSAWYWHFVDVVWLFLFISIYWWGFEISGICLNMYEV